MHTLIITNNTVSRWGRIYIQAAMDNTCYAIIVVLWVVELDGINGPWANNS